MTAKEKLRAFVDELSEGEAEHWVFATAADLVEQILMRGGRISSVELLRLPPNLRTLILKLQALYYTAEDAARDAAEAEEWEVGTGKDLRYIDA